MTLRETVENYCRRKMGRAPDLEKPRGYNDKLAWLKMHDHMPEHVVCCDKLSAREHVASVIGRGYLLDVHQTGERTADLDPRAPVILKANHDSGTAKRVHYLSHWREACLSIDRALSRQFGGASGEWAYQKIARRCFTEELLPSPVVEYKFHSGSGRIFWSQVIVGRAAGRPSEANFDARGKRLPLHFNFRNDQVVGGPALPSTWSHLTEVAEELSKPFRYVRVDLFSHQGRVYFNELTFWPLAGVCATKDEPIFGEMLDIDLSFRRPALA